MKEKVSSLIITMTIIGMLSALALSFVYSWTEPRIEEHRAERLRNAVFNVLPDSEDYNEVEKNDEVFYEGIDSSGNKVGVAVIATGPGFQGEIDVVVGVNPRTEKLYGIEILDHEETPGLGARIEDEEYKDNFVDKPFGDYNVIKGHSEGDYDIEAISGATVSSENVAEIVEEAIDLIKNVYRGDAG